MLLRHSHLGQFKSFSTFLTSLYKLFFTEQRMKIKIVFSRVSASEHFVFRKYWRSGKRLFCFKRLYKLFFTEQHSVLPIPFCILHPIVLLFLLWIPPMFCDPNRFEHTWVLMRQRSGHRIFRKDVFWQVLLQEKDQANIRLEKTQAKSSSTFIPLSFFFCFFNLFPSDLR